MFRTAFRLCAIALAFLVAEARAVSLVEDCDDLSSIPINADVKYADIHLILTDCISCHMEVAASGGLDLESAPASLIYVQSAQNGSVIRVLPADPKNSLLFQKVNCEIQDTGADRMPVGGKLPPQDQALIYDWIEQGARAFIDGDPLSDVVFRDTFESER